MPSHPTVSPLCDSCSSSRCFACGLLQTSPPGGSPCRPADGSRCRAQSSRGLTWQTACTYLQDALADANDSEKPVEIRVAQGVYRPDEGAALRNQGIDFRRSRCLYQGQDTEERRGRGFFVSSSHRKKAPTSEVFPCAECGEPQMVRVVETCRLADGLQVKNLAHYKCGSCGSRFFDDDAMNHIAAARASHRSSASTC